MKYGIHYAYWEKERGADYIRYVGKVKKINFDGNLIMKPFVKMSGQVGSDIKVW